MGRRLRDGRWPSLHDTPVRSESGSIAWGGTLAPDGDHCQRCVTFSHPDLSQYFTVDTFPPTRFMVAGFAGGALRWRELIHIIKLYLNPLLLRCNFDTILDFRF